MIVLSLAPVIMLASIHNRGADFSDEGWRYASIDTSALMVCTNNIDMNILGKTVRRYYALDGLSKHYKNARLDRILCIKGTKILVAFMSVSGISDKNPSYILNDKGELLGKFMYSPFYHQSW